MPVIINELIVTAMVSEKTGPPDRDGQKNKNLDKKEIIEECVEEVLRVLEQKEER